MSHGFPRTSRQCRRQLILHQRALRPASSPDLLRDPAITSLHRNCTSRLIPTRWEPWLRIEPASPTLCTTTGRRVTSPARPLQRLIGADVRTKVLFSAAAATRRGNRCVRRVRTCRSWHIGAAWPSVSVHSTAVAHVVTARRNLRTSRGRAELLTAGRGASHALAGLGAFSRGEADTSDAQQQKRRYAQRRQNLSHPYAPIGRER